MTQGTSPKKGIAELTRMIRLTLGMTQVQLAHRIHKTQRLVTRIENEEVDPRLSTIRKIAEGLNCDLEIQLAPKEAPEKFMGKKAEEKALKLVMMNTANAAMELQKPSPDLIKKQVAAAKREILEKHREVLWQEE